MMLFGRIVMTMWVLGGLGSFAAASRADSDAAADPVTLLRGRAAYRAACEPCHGAGGDGESDVSRYLDPPPRDFRKAVYKFQTTPCGSLAPESDIVRVVTQGLPGTKMPAWEGVLTESEIAAVADYVKDALAQRRPSAEPMKVSDEPGPDAAGVERGRRVFELLECAKCHGASGRGDGPSARTLKDDWGRPIEPRDLSRSLYKSGGTNPDLYRVIAQGICGTPMPSHGDLVTTEELWDLVHYVRSLGKEKGWWGTFFGVE